MLSRLPRCILLTTRYSKYSTSASHANKNSVIVDADELGIPKAPTWSVNELLNSYPPVELSDETITRLHNAAALVPPMDPIQFQTIREDLAGLIKVVEAVRMVPLLSTPSSYRSSVKRSDGRIWPEETSMDLRDYAGYEDETRNSSTPPEGRELLNRAKGSQDGFYVVPSPTQLIKTFESTHSTSS